MAPKVSVIVPIYNVKQYLKAMLDSVSEQKFEEFEVLLIDDGSSDGSAEIAKAYAAKDKRYRYIRQENAGVSAARNRGIEEAKGDYLAFYDADDIVPEKALLSMHKAGETQQGRHCNRHYGREEPWRITALYAFCKAFFSKKY